MKYSKKQLEELDTIEQAWDGDELKMQEGNTRVWLTHSENRKYNGDYTIETRIEGRWEQENCLFDF